MQLNLPPYTRALTKPQPMDRQSVERFVGLRYVPGEFDCADFVILVQRELFGRSVTVPQDRNRPTDLLAQWHEIRAWLPDLVRQRQCDEIYQNGDGVLLAVGGLSSHLGVLVTLEERYVLHADSARVGSVLTRWRDLRMRGFWVSGVYAWN